MSFQRTAPPPIEAFAVFALAFFALAGFFFWRFLVVRRQLRESRARTKRLERCIALIDKMWVVKLTDEELYELAGLTLEEGLLPNHCPDCEQEGA